MIKLIEGDCLIELPKLEAKSVDMIMVDTPFGTTACAWDTIIPFVPMWEQIKRVTKKNAAIVMCASQPFTSKLIMSNLDWFKYEWIWVKSRPTGTMLAKRQPMRNVESVVVFYVKQPTYNRQMIKRTPEEFKSCYRKNNSESKNGEQMRHSKNPLIRQSRDRQWYKPPQQTLFFKSDAKRDGKSHPTQKPVALMDYLIKTYTNEGDTVLDFTMGSGTTGVACRKLNRNFIGIEKDEKYFEIAEKRIADASDLFTDLRQPTEKQEDMF